MQHIIGMAGGDRFRGCKDCRMLEDEAAATAPHEMLEMVSSTGTASGIREDFVCKSCGQRMQRFKAIQTSPPPSDRWRVA